MGTAHAPDQAKRQSMNRWSVKWQVVGTIKGQETPVTANNGPPSQFMKSSREKQTKQKMREETQAQGRRKKNVKKCPPPPRILEILEGCHALLKEQRKEITYCSDMYGIDGHAKGSKEMNQNKWFMWFFSYERGVYPAPRLTSQKPISPKLFQEVTRLMNRLNRSI